VTYLDAQLGTLFEHMRQVGHYDDTLVCLTASQSLPLGEHGMIGWPEASVAAPLRVRLHEELVHLPLILRLPGAESAGLRVSALTQPLDVAATVLDSFGMTPPGHGHSLWPLIRGEANEVRPYACSAAPCGNGMEWALRTRDWALLLPAENGAGQPVAQAQLYVKPDDRWEVNDVRQRHLELAEELEARLRAFASSTDFPWASGP
jgi:arylsulfatase A-like enzyme